MTEIRDVRIVEMKALQNLVERKEKWEPGVCMQAGTGQSESLGISPPLYADLILTLLEDGYLSTTEEVLREKLYLYTRSKDLVKRYAALKYLETSKIYLPISVTYRGLRRIEELRDSLRRDRILEPFGILLDVRYLTSDLNRFLRDAGGEPVSLLFADVDYFGRFNKDHGHQAGDAVLRQVFRIISSAVGDRGAVYRRGGDEVVAILPYCGSKQSEDIAERIREEVANNAVQYSDKILHVTLSVGLATSPPCDPDGPALESKADYANHQAKEKGRNQVVVVEA